MKQGRGHMVLNPDCVRDVLLCVESCGFGERLNLSGLHERLPDYAEEDLWYTCLKLQDGGLLDVLALNMMNAPMPVIKEIGCMTYQGHEFLNTIREKSNWEKTKDVAKKTGVGSLKFLGEIAQEVAKAAVSSALQTLL